MTAASTQTNPFFLKKITKHPPPPALAWPPSESKPSEGMTTTVNSGLSKKNTSVTLNRLMAIDRPTYDGDDHLLDDLSDGVADDYDPTTAADPDFYSGRAPQLADDIYDFSRLKPSLRLDSSSNNPTDDEEEGTRSIQVIQNLHRDHPSSIFNPY